MNNDEWFIIKDLDGFINSSRALVFNNFGSNKDSTDDLKLEINKEDQDELNNILSFDESRIILMSLIKKQKNKKTNDIRYVVNDELFMTIVESLNDRMVSNLLNNLVNKGVIETGFDSDSNDFVFWIKDNDKNKTEKPETD
jgi:hypothetical protein